ncbi:acyl-CoA dehydrogenase family protein [Amycolatopsis viridis]|uniref:Acyl-CoA oxidase n=1 Tax=Amycolatopsis viridis TaxID=185678 RepID=A0ABX0STE9_9PSEU|nr:acyl-CoA dehydrogenase [Amycolatopsis viridis]NIH78621.1 acyl-CoA oxidase [Amycolatopsis viridis]
MNPDALTAVLDGQWAQLRREIRAQFADYDHDEPHDLSTEEYRAWVLERLRELAKSGWHRLGFSTEYGGGGDIGGSVVSFEMLGYGDLSLMVKSGVQWGLFGGAIQLLGTAHHHERYLARIMDLDLLGCFAMTETGHGSDVQHLRTTATYDPATREFVIDTPDEQARKDYIGNAARHGRMAVVFAQLVTGGESRGVHAFVVPIRDEAGAPLAGVEIGDDGRKAGLNGVDNGRLTFHSVRVPRDALLNRYGDVTEDGTYTSPIDSDNRRFFTMLGTLIRGRVSVAGGAIHATERALAIATRYAEQRRQFARPDGSGEVVLLDYRAHQRKLLPAIARTYALHFAHEELTRALHDLQSSAEAGERAQRELESRAAGIKAVATWHATRTIQIAREACGGAGYLAENLLPALKADTDVFTTFEGDNTVLLQLVAKGLLTSYRDHFADLSPLATARLVAEQFVGAVIERTAARKVIERLVDAAPGRDDDGVLFDRGWQLKLFEDREQHVLEGCARRLRRAAEADPFEVFNDAQDHVLRAARVHVDRVVLEAFVAAIDRCADEEARALLNRLCDLYVLSNVEEDRAWFLEHGRLTSPRSKAVVAAVNDLCAELRPHARLLVDGFAVPEPFLRPAMLR